MKNMPLFRAWLAQHPLGERYKTMSAFDCVVTNYVGYPVSAELFPAWMKQVVFGGVSGNNGNNPNDAEYDFQLTDAEYDFQLDHTYGAAINRLDVIMAQAGAPPTGGAPHVA